MESGNGNENGNAPILDSEMRNHENDYFLKSDIFRWRLSEKCLNLKSSIFDIPPKTYQKPMGKHGFALRNH